MHRKQDSAAATFSVAAQFNFQLNNFYFLLMDADKKKSYRNNRFIKSPISILSRHVCFNTIVITIISVPKINVFLYNVVKHKSYKCLHIYIYCYKSNESNEPKIVKTTKRRASREIISLFELGSENDGDHDTARTCTAISPRPRPSSRPPSLITSST